MSDAVTSTLKQLVATRGPALLERPREVEALLRDLCGEHRRDIMGVVAALEAKVPRELAHSSAVPYEALEGRLVQRILADQPLSEEAARRAVRALAEALGRAPT